MIQFVHVTKQYEGEPEPVLRDFCAVIEDGEFVLLTGESGIGKSTCIRLLLREIPVTSGEIPPPPAPQPTHSCFLALAFPYTGA